MSELKFPDVFFGSRKQTALLSTGFVENRSRFSYDEPPALAETAKVRPLQFPKGFLWGSSTSSYQVEGGIENNDWAQAAKFQHGHLASDASKMPMLPAAGQACDHYNRYGDDFDIAKSLGQNAHRFSIEWVRIEPEEGRFDENAVEHYRKVLQALRGRGLEPFVTLWHFTLPIWFAKLGGFENKKAPFYFARYCEYVVRNLGGNQEDAPLKEGHPLGGGVNFFITINEPMIYASQGYLRGVWPPFKKNIFKFMKVVDNLAMSHNATSQKIKTVQPTAQIGIAKNQINFEANKNPANRLLAKFLIWFWNHKFLAKISKSQDFIGVNYYFHKKFGTSGDRKARDYEKSDMGWDIYPKGIYNALMELKRYHKPVYITENGVADAQDRLRAKFIRDHLYWVHRAIHDGCDVRGYFYWSLLDNFEWIHGFEPRFGLVEMKYKTMERKIRPSAYEYKKICESNVLTTRN